MKPDRPTFSIVIRSERPDPSGDVRQLRELLKRLLRNGGFRALAIAEVNTVAPKPQTEAAGQI